MVGHEIFFFNQQWQLRLLLPNPTPIVADAARGIFQEGVTGESDAATRPEQDDLGSEHLILIGRTQEKLRACQEVSNGSKVGNR